MGSKKKASAKRKTKTPVKTFGLINLKVTALERKNLTLAAKKFADGNLSAWLRYAGRHFRPKKGEIIR